MIDMHSHILPGVDDGAKTVNDSLLMLEESFRQGVEVCVSTSHLRIHNSDSVDDFLIRRQNAYEELISHSQGKDVPKIVLGAEVFLDNDISKHPDIEKLCIDGTKFMLVEFGGNASPDKLSDWLYNLILKDITPIIAHIDRYGNRNEMIEVFDGLNIIYQVNNCTVMSMFGRKFMKKLSDFPVVMGSDMHNMTTRPCDMKKAYDIVSKKMSGSEEFLFLKNARSILNL